MEFDPIKDKTNQEKHGVSLAFGSRIFEDQNHLVIPSLREIDGEERFKAVGLIDGKFYTAVFVWRKQKRRFISVRRSNEKEKKHYHSC